MGRAYTEPEIVDEAGAFWIRREADPDDEWQGDIEYLSRLGLSLVWAVDETDGIAVRFATRTQAEIVLAAYRFGQE